MKKIVVISRTQLSARTKKKFQMTREHKVSLRGYEYKRKFYPEVAEVPSSAVEVYCYYAEVNPRKERRLMKGRQYQIKEEVGYWYEEKYRKFLLVWLLLYVLMPIMAVGGLYHGFVRNDDTIDDQKYVIVSEDKEEAREEQKNIIYQGFTKSFEINKKTQILSIQNSEENIDHYYTGVQLVIGDKVIYDMEDSLIEPGKYVNINLYELLDPGAYDLEIVQYGYHMDTMEPVSSVSSQMITVEVKGD